MPERLALPRYCQLCGRFLVERFVPQERRLRQQCEACGFIHYVNPRIVVCAIPERDERLLLQRRAIEPSLGLWTFPGGFLEAGEAAEAGAVRETKEEVGLDVALDGLLGVYSRPHVAIVVAVYRARAAVGEAIVGDHESSEVRWFAVDEIPWDELAFETTVAALHDWVERRGA